MKGSNRCLRTACTVLYINFFHQKKINVLEQQIIPRISVAINLKAFERAILLRSPCQQQYDYMNR